MTTDVAAIVCQYQAFVELSRQVLAAARASNWDLVLELDRQRLALLAAIKQADTGAAMGAEGLARKKPLVDQYLAFEAETRTLVAAWMADLKTTMLSNSQEQKLIKHYGAMAAIEPPSWPE